MSNKHFIPANFEIPKGLETNRLKIRMLKVTDVAKDYDAVMSSVAYLQKTKPFGPNQRWPIGLTIEQNLIDLGWHQKEFQMRSTFAYTVMSLDETKCLGCLYIEPSTKIDYDAEVYMWVRQSEVQSGLDKHLFETTQKWINTIWPFKKVAYPGREIDWQEWKKQK